MKKVKPDNKTTVKICQKYATQLLPIFKAFAKEYIQRICKESCKKSNCPYETKIHETAFWFINSTLLAMFFNYGDTNMIRLLKLFKDALFECEDAIFDIAEGIKETQKEGENE